MSDKFIHKLFATPVFQFKVKDHEKLNADLSKYIYDLHESDKEGAQRSNVGGWHSKNFKVEKGNTPHKFINSIHGYVKEVIVDGFGWKFNPEKVGVTEIWAIINKKNAFNEIHNHPNTYLSAAYYVKAPSNCGDIHFYEPNEVKKFRHPVIEKATELNTTGFSIKAAEGNLVIFPSYLYHSVGKNLSSEDRVIISFNVDIITYKDAKF